MKETLEEAAERILWDNTGMLAENNHVITQSMIDLAKWQSERMYSEEVKIIDSNLFYNMANSEKGLIHKYESFEEWFSQFKK